MTDLLETPDALPRIVSVDDHVVEPPDLWQRWLPAALRAAGPHVERRPYAEVQTPDGRTLYQPAANGPTTDWWVLGDRWAHIPQVMACVGLPREQLSAGPISFAEMRPGCYEPKARLADMDAGHVEASLCFPNFARFCGQTLSEIPDKELSIACLRAYNDWMIDEWCGDSDGRLIPLCVVPLWDPSLAGEFVRQNAARGCRAVAFSEQPAALGFPSIHDRNRHWDPFLAACEETGTVVCMHIGSSSRMTGTTPDAPAGVTMALTFANSQSALVDWLLSGAMARFPHLKIAFSEGQIGWIPFVLERLDNVVRHSSAWAQLPPEMTELPSAYYKDRVYGCFFDDDFGLSVRDRIGLHQITFETDYPHQDSTWPHSRDVVARMATQLTPYELERVVRANALEMLGR